jgi:hypothetical protein
MVKFVGLEDLSNWIRDLLTNPESEDRVTVKEKPEQEKVSKAIQEISKVDYDESTQSEIITIPNCLENLMNKVYGYDKDFITSAEGYAKQKKDLVDCIIKKNRKRLRSIWKTILKDIEAYRSLWEMVDKLPEYIKLLDSWKVSEIKESQETLVSIAEIAGAEKSIKEIRRWVEILKDPHFSHKYLIFQWVVMIMEENKLPVIYPLKVGFDPTWAPADYQLYTELSGKWHLADLKRTVTTGRRLLDTQVEIKGDIKKAIIAKNAELIEMTKRIAALPEAPSIPELPAPEKTDDEIKAKE